jgi:hypothetical protein
MAPSNNRIYFHSDFFSEKRIPILKQFWHGNKKHILSDGNDTNDFNAFLFRSARYT